MNERACSIARTQSEFILMRYFRCVIVAGFRHSLSRQL